MDHFQPSQLQALACRSPCYWFLLFRWCVKPSNSPKDQQSHTSWGGPRSMAVLLLAQRCCRLWVCRWCRRLQKALAWISQMCQCWSPMPRPATSSFLWRFAKACWNFFFCAGFSGRKWYGHTMCCVHPTCSSADMFDCYDHESWSWNSFGQLTSQGFDLPGAGCGRGHLLLLFLTMFNGKNFWMLAPPNLSDGHGRIHLLWRHLLWRNHGGVGYQVLVAYVPGEVGRVKYWHVVRCSFISFICCPRVSQTL